MGASFTSLCGNSCFAGFSQAKSPKKFVPRKAPVQNSTLSFQARIAARKGDPDTIDLLRDYKGQSLHNFDAEGRTLLFYAVRGTRDDYGKLEPAGGTMAGPTMKHYSPGIQQGDAARHLMEKYSFDVNFQVHDTGMTPLMEAARYGNVEAAEILLRFGANRKLQNVNGHTALDIAQKKLPEYLELKETMCSSNRWDVMRAAVDNDRGLVYELLEEKQESNS